jgi:acetolactate synthase-1/2/3 large subunit
VFSESGHASAWKAFREADVVLAVGNSLNQHATFGLRTDLFDGKMLIQVNISATEIGKTYPADHALVSDARLAVEAVTDALGSRVGPAAPAKVAGQDYEARKILRLPGAIHPGQLAQAIGRMLPEDGVILADAGAHLAWLGYYVELGQGQNFRKTGTFGPMSAHVNGAIGVKLAEPGRTVVVGCGDGCYSMAGFELMTALQNDVPVIWVIFNDGEYKLVTLTEFENAFAAALTSGRPTVIDAKITRWALPHYSTSPEGVIPGIWETLEERFRRG